MGIRDTPGSLGSSWLQSMEARVEAERAARGELPDPRSMRLSVDGWRERAAAAGLRPLCDIEGRPEGVSDDDLYDAVERTMRAEGRDPDRFSAMRPPRQEGWSGDLPPNEYIQAAAGFELRVAPEGDEVVARVLRVGGASLGHTHDGLLAKGCWREVDRGPLLTATQAIFGEVPRYPSPPLSEHVWTARCGHCDACDSAIPGDALTISVHGEEVARWQGAEVARLHLRCAHRVTPDRVSAALAEEPALRERFADVFELDRGKLQRCRECEGILRKPAWRLVAPYAKQALHLECAVTAAPAGLREALLEAPEGFEPSAWLERV